ncbi:MAG: hypothetical protein IVW52_12715 [Acidimicrobiales bacterium]|nr:hypothetical protein [Acidimicrobiales bacterium]
MLDEWKLAWREVVERGTAEAEGATHYEVRRAEAVEKSHRGMPLHRRMRVSADQLAADYDAAHLVVCEDCGIPRHDRDEESRETDRSCCPACGGALVPEVDSPELPPSLSESLRAIEDRLAAFGFGGR